MADDDHQSDASGEDEEDEFTLEARKYLTEGDWQEMESSIGENPSDSEIEAYNARIKERLELRKQQVEAAEGSDADDDDEEEMDDEDEEGEEAEEGEEGEEAPEPMQEEEDAVDQPETRLKNMRAAFDEMEKELKTLRNENSTLKAENARLTTAFDVATKRLVQAPASMLSRDNMGPEVVLHQIFEVQQGCRLEDIPAPHRFSSAGAFPHAIAVSLKTGFREYQVSKSRKITLKFNLAKKSDLSKASEHDVCPGGLLSFQMQVVYADNPDEAVKVSDFARSATDSITTHEGSSTKSVVNGELFFTFQFTVSSRDTSPADRAFMVKVWPVDEALQRNPDLTQYTPAFIVRAKVTAPKGGP